MTGMSSPGKLFLVKSSRTSSSTRSSSSGSSTMSTLMRNTTMNVTSTCRADPLLDLRLGDELGREVRGNLGVVAELHGIAGSTLGHRPQVCGVAEHLGERDRAADDLRRAAGVHPLDLAAPAVEVADDV